MDDNTDHKIVVSGILVLSNADNSKYPTNIFHSTLILVSQDNAVYFIF